MSNTPNKPKAPEAPVKSDIQIESNDAVSAFDQVKVESVVEDRGGLIIETFVGLQPNVDWAETPATLAIPAIPADAFGAE